MKKCWVNPNHQNSCTNEKVYVLVFRLLSKNIIYGCPKEKSAKFWECQFVTASSPIKMPDIRAEISSFSKQSENVLLLLLRENEDIKSMLKGE